MRGRMVAVAVVAILTTATVAATRGDRAATPAEAEISVAPADGQRLAQPPHQVTLRVTGAIDPAQSHIVVTDHAGATYAVGDPVVEAGTLQQRVRAGDGAFLVTYHLVLRDGRESSGQSGYAVGDYAAPPPQESDPPAGVSGHDHGSSGALGVVLSALFMTLGGWVLVMLLIRPSGARSRTQR